MSCCCCWCHCGCAPLWACVVPPATEYPALCNHAASTTEGGDLPVTGDCAAVCIWSKFSKVRCAIIVYTKFQNELTFENFFLVTRKCAVVCIWLKLLKKLVASSLSSVNFTANRRLRISTCAATGDLARASSFGAMPVSSTENASVYQSHEIHIRKTSYSDMTQLVLRIVLHVRYCRSLSAKEPLFIGLVCGRYNDMTQLICDMTHLRSSWGNNPM